jgi:hypothetical protein
MQHCRTGDLVPQAALSRERVPASTFRVGIRMPGDRYSLRRRSRSRCDSAAARTRGGMLVRCLEMVIQGLRVTRGSWIAPRCVVVLSPGGSRSAFTCSEQELVDGAHRSGTSPAASQCGIGDNPSSQVSRAGHPEHASRNRVATDMALQETRRSGGLGAK